MEAGTSVLVQYPDDARPELWQERFLLAQLGRRSRWLAATPDDDIVEVDLQEMSFRVLGPGRSLPVGLAEEQCYLVFKP